MNIEFKIRKDFQSIEEEIFKLNEYGQIFHDIRDEYTRFKNQEDFHEIYSLEKQFIQTFELLSNSGADCSFSIHHILQNIDYFDFYPTVTDLINELEEKFSCVSELTIVLFKSKEACTQLDLSLYSIEEMNRLHEKQLNYLSKIKNVIVNIKESDLYKKENNIFISHELPHKYNQPEKFYEKWWVISLLVGLLGGILTWWNFSYQFGIIIALILFFLMIIFNPKRRFLRIGLGLLTLGSMSLSPSFIDWISEILKLNIHINPWIGALLIIGSFFLFFLDHKIDDK